MHRAVPLLAAVLMAVPVVAVESSDLDRLMSALAARRHGHAAFTEQKFLAVLDRPVESSGELLYEAPDHLEKNTLKPRPESLVLQAGVVSVQRGKHHYLLDLKQYPQVVPFIESIRATLAGDRPALEKVFKVDLGGSFEGWQLTLVPLDGRLVRAVTSIRIEGEQDRVHVVHIQEADGDHSTLTIGHDLTP